MLLPHLQNIDFYQAVKKLRKNKNLEIKCIYEVQKHLFCWHLHCFVVHLIGIWSKVINFCKTQPGRIRVGLNNVLKPNCIQQENFIPVQSLDKNGNGKKQVCICKRLFNDQENDRADTNKQKVHRNLWG